MKKTLILLSILTSFVASAQSIEINPNGGTNASAVLDLKSTTKGFLPPRMTNEQMRAIPNPAQGLLAFCTDCGTTANGEYYFYKGTAWVILSSTTVSSFTSIGAVSDVATPQGATVTSDGVLNLAPANATNPGIVTTGAQTIAGIKTFSNGIIGNVSGNVIGNVTGNADAATKITSITNSDIVQLTSTQTLTNKTLTSPTITGTGAIAGTFTGDLTGNVTGNASTATIATNVSGTVPVANGGTGATTLTANSVLLGNGTSTLQAVAPGANGNVLTSNGTTWTSAATTIPLPAGSTKGSIMYNNGSSWATLAPGAEGQFLKMSSSGIPVWGDAATSAVLAGTASSTPTLTVNTALTNITHATLGATGIGTASSLPTGVSATWSGNVVTISGTPSTVGTFNYTIPLTGTGCTSLNAMGTITVNSTSATLTTTAVSSIMTTGASSGGNISYDGGASVTARGVVWSTSTGPTVSLTTKTTDGTGTGSFTSNISGLTTGTTYYVRAYATNSAGTSYGSELTFATCTLNTAGTPSTSPTLIVNTALTNITIATTGATGIGTVSGLPDGVTANWSGNVITISGTPTATGTFNYTILLTGGCGTVNAMGTITVTTTTATLTTTAISNITSFSASSGVNISSDGGASVSAHGLVYGTFTNPTLLNNYIVLYLGFGTGSFSSTIPRLSPNTTYYIRAYATNSAGTAYGNEISFTTLPTITGTVTDIDGNTYSTVQLGTQVWMSENLKTSRYRNGESIPNITTDNTAWSRLTTGAWSYYNNEDANNAIYGKLYNWYAVTDIRGLCPTGWHVPSDAEWTTLTTYLGGESEAGSKMKSTGTTYWNSPNNDATNESGFSVLPGGFRYVDGSFFNIRSNAFFWSVTELDDYFVWYRSLISNFGNVYRDFDIYGSENRASGISVRCLRD